MAKTIETMGAMWPTQFDALTFGFEKGVGGTLAPSGFDGNEIIQLIGEIDAVTMMLAEANTDLTTTIVSTNYVGQANVAATLTTVDGITFSGTSVDFVNVLTAAADANVSINVYFQTTNTAVDVAPFHTTDHGAAHNPAVHEEGSLVRVGSPPADPVSYPNHQDGWDSTDLSGDKYP